MRMAWGCGVGAWERVAAIPSEEVLVEPFLGRGKHEVCSGAFAGSVSSCRRMPGPRAQKGGIWNSLSTMLGEVVGLDEVSVARAEDELRSVLGGRGAGI